MSMLPDNCLFDDILAKAISIGEWFSRKIRVR